VIDCATNATNLMQRFSPSSSFVDELLTEDAAAVLKINDERRRRRA
ncbi:hypothetical protein A2U01_0095314, partial [Trifolium medium]|nr:hypothetical protein [Trifolium medium]